jgi:hypothetical protein
VEAFGTARLTDEIAAGRAVAAVVPRAEITDILREGETPQLELQIVARDLEAPSTISITWSRDDLERLLEQATGEHVVLTFDRDELAAAVGDVEAHGLKERMAVFAVAAGILGATPAIANAMAPDPGSGGGGPAVVQVAGADSTVTDASTGGYAVSTAAAAADSTVTDASTAGYAAQGDQSDVVSRYMTSHGLTNAAGPADSTVTDATGGYAAAAGPADSIVTDATTGGYAAPAGPADSIVTDATTGGYAAATDQSDVVSRYMTSHGIGSGAASAADTRVTDASSAGGYAAQPTSDSGLRFSVHNPNLADELLAGGVLLAIAGATFTARRSSGTVRPA